MWRHRQIYGRVPRPSPETCRITSGWFGLARSWLIYELTLTPFISENSQFNPLDSGGNYSATSKLVHWPLMGGLLHLVHWGGAWAGCSPTQSPPRCNICNSPLINGQCTNHRIAIIWCMVRFSAVLMWRIKRIKGLISTSQMTILLLDYRLTMYLSSRSSSFKTIEIQIKYRKSHKTEWVEGREAWNSPSHQYVTSYINGQIVNN